MVQQTINSKFSEYVLANPETGFPKHDKQLSVPQAAKKIALRDLQNENRSMVPKSDGSSLLNGLDVEAVKVTGTKRSQPECIMQSHHQQTPTSNNGHLVYVRRKTESEQHKSSTKKLYEHDEKNHGLSPMKDSTMCIRKDAPEPKTSADGVSSTTPLVTLDSGKSNITPPVADSNCLQLDNPKRLSVQHWEERYFRLQNFLKALDQSNQDDYRQMLRSLTSVELSRIAVELEKRSIQLSLEEAREVQRAKLVDVVDKFPRSGGEHRST